MEAAHRHWPLAELVLRTPRLELRPDDDAGLAELADRALEGIHPPGEMPFLVPWTDSAGTPGFARGVLQHAWGRRADLAPESWTVIFLVREAGRVLGMQALTGRRFPVLREVETGSWLTTAAQGRGIGTEMRAAVLALAVDHLGARTARTGAFVDNVASNTVSRRLGYREDGVDTVERRGEPAPLQRFVLAAEAFARPPWTLQVHGLAPCLPLLGLAGTG